MEEIEEAEQVNKEKSNSPAKNTKTSPQVIVLDDEEMEEEKVTEITTNEMEVVLRYHDLY